MNFKKQKIVILAGEIYPRIAPRSFRATELAKALAKKGHEVTIYAVLGKFDYKHFESKYNLKVKNLGNSSFFTKNSDGKVKLPLWRLGIIFFLYKILEFPDILLLNKAKNKVLDETKFDLLITVAVPYPLHWGVSFIPFNKRNFKTWISDCGDPFMKNSVTKPLPYFYYFEKHWCKKTDFITVPIEEAKQGYYKEFRDKIHTIPQGFNFEEVEVLSYFKNKIPTFLYAGLFYAEVRDPRPFLEYLVTLDYDFKFIVYATKIDLIEKYKIVLKDKLEVRNPVDRLTLIKEMSSVDFLINIQNKNITAQVPSKLIDYTLSKRPILEISSDFENKEKKNFENFIKGDFSKQKIVDNIEKYNCDNVAEQFLKLHYKNE